MNMKGEDGEYRSDTFIEVLRKVMNGLTPFEALLRHDTYQRRARSISAYYGDENTREEIFQELGRRLSLNLHKFVSESSEDDDVFKWMSTVASRISIDMHRKYGKHTSPGVRNDTPVDELNVPDTAPDPYLNYLIKEWIASLTPRQRRIYQIYTEGLGGDPEKNRKISSRKIAEVLTSEGIECSHATVLKEWRELRESCLKMLRIGTRKQAQAGSA